MSGAATNRFAEKRMNAAGKENAVQNRSALNLPHGEAK